MGIDIDYNLWEKEARERAVLQEEEPLAKDVLMLLEQLSFERRVNKRVCGIARELARVRDAAEKLRKSGPELEQRAMHDLNMELMHLSPEAKNWPARSAEVAE
jgi:hypothetical protein